MTTAFTARAALVVIVAGSAVPAVQGAGERAPVIIRGVPYSAVRASAEVEEGGVASFAAVTQSSANAWTPRTPFQCDPDATPALEPPLNFPGSIWGSPAMDPYVAQGQLLDQGCFSIIGCINGIRLPAANAAPSAGPNWKVCGTIGNFLDSASANVPLLTSALDNNNQPVMVTPAAVGCPGGAPPQTPVQRDQDLVRFSVPAGGWENFRITFGAAVTFQAALYCNAAFPAPGQIDNCWFNNNSQFPDEFGFSPRINGEVFSAVSGGPIINPVEPSGNLGDRDSTISFPLVGPGVFLPEGEYIAMIRVVQISDPRWALQGGPFPANSPYQITVTATLPPPCGCVTNLVNDPLSPGCRVDTADLTALLGQFGKTCGQVSGVCADFNADGSINTPDLVRFLGEFGKSSVNGVCQ